MSESANEADTKAWSFWRVRFLILSVHRGHSDLRIVSQTIEVSLGAVDP